MANPEHLAILKQGPKAWMAWRKTMPFEFRPDLTNANLQGMNLKRTFLAWTDLRMADLSEATLVESNFEVADLSLAYLSGADLTEACFEGADLGHAKLARANLTRATLTSANLTAADLSDAILDDTLFGGTNLGMANLARASGLIHCRHLRPSVIDIHALHRSGPLPVAFLRGCGLPDALIDYLPSLLKQPIQYHSCFISYSTKNSDFAERLHADLQNSGVRCWFAPENLKIGDKNRERIDESIWFHDRLLLVLSAQSIASDWVAHEVELALRKELDEKRTVLFPVRLDDAIFEAKVGWVNDVLTRNIGDFRKWKDHDNYQNIFDRLLRDLKAEDTKPKP